MVAECSFPRELPKWVLASLQGLGTIKAGSWDVAAEEAIRAKLDMQRVGVLDDDVCQHIARALAELDEAVACLRQRGLAANALLVGNMREVNVRIKAYEARAQVYRQLVSELAQLPAPEPCGASEREIWRRNGPKQLLCL
mmetsp:Transcript_61774/g.143734  ORF Transcript_61774/g.143734 Transcript_61774/m.143734 type:complete len:140 (+) Transcript_61774:55-474(+)